MVQPKSDYDVVIIGSGIAGLSAGALLSHAGYKTLVVDKLDYVGGRWSNEEYEGFKLDRGAHMIEVGGKLEQTFEDVGAKWELVHAPRLWWKLGGNEYEMPPKGSMKRLFEIANELETQRAKPAGQISKEIPLQELSEALRRGFSEPENEVGPTVRDWVLQFTESKYIYDIFDKHKLFVSSSNVD